MKVYSTEHVHGINQAKNAGHGKTGDTSFDTLLRQRIENATVSPSGTAATQGPDRTAGVYLSPDTALDKSEIMSRIDAFLDTLQLYRDKLASPENTPRDLAAVIARMESEHMELQQLSDCLASDDDLRPLLEETLILSTVEITKFNRGDYIPT